ncbi:MAG: sulfatase-like hydrolase/transferase, partial [Bacteroidetes bacterium]|nr:sulfatase-like hydrolase/transferase [Bacteroidota bacterium]
MNNFRICIGVLLLSLVFNWVDANAAQSQDQPNVLIILTDDQGYHDVSYYGTGDLQTPNIDQLAEEGMRFDNFYANSSVCAPTRAALLSGQYQDFVGVPGVIRTYA